jgi:hypothetical protein
MAEGFLLLLRELLEGEAARAERAELGYLRTAQGPERSASGTPL